MTCTIPIITIIIPIPAISYYIIPIQSNSYYIAYTGITGKFSVVVPEDTNGWEMSVTFDKTISR